MKLSVSSQGLLVLLCSTITLCEDRAKPVEIGNKEFFKSAQHVLQQGRLISQSKAVHAVPADQAATSGLQPEDPNKTKSKFIAHGDILTPVEALNLSASQRIKRKVIAETNYFGGGNRWPRGVVPYQLAANLDSRVQQNFLNAIEHWQKRTCIRFERYNPKRHWDIAAKITIEDTGSGCATYVGYRSAVTGQPSSYAVYLPAVCEFGSAVHELGHVIGFYHEMARTDRDKEINLYFNLMGTVEAVQYDIMPNPMPGYYGQPYDLSSIMHYYPTKVMSARDSRRVFLMGQRNGLSFLDTKLANLAYHCSDVCRPKPVCENEGFVSQHCQCVCPDGFAGDRCQLLKGYSETIRVQPPPKPTETKESTTTVQTTTAASKSIRWLEWTEWSNCSEACGTGIRVRTRLCSNTTIDGSADPCASLGGDSFEIESCQNVACPQNDIILSCTFDLPNETCPIQTETQWHIRNGTYSDQPRPISDHTRGDGKYLFLTGNASRSNPGQKIRLGPFLLSASSDRQNHCVQFWYSTHGQGLGQLQLVPNDGTNQTNEEISIFNEKDQNTNWKQFQQTISSDRTSALVFTYISRTTEYSYLALDDISILNGVCAKKTSISEVRRKRRQTTTACSQIFDLTTTNNMVTITSPNYPNLYPSNVQCYYFLRAPKSYRINLQFTDFNTPVYSANKCDDTVEIRYYHLGQVGPIYCGSGANSDNLQFRSSQNNLMIVFQSNQQYAGRGFRAQATLVQ